LKFGDPGLGGFDDDDILTLEREPFRQIGADSAGTNDDNSHVDQQC
jgi:hypothetical protein